MMLLLFWWSAFIPSRKVFTYNHMALMSLQSHSHIKASMVSKYYFKTYFNDPEWARMCPIYPLI